MAASGGDHIRAAGAMHPGINAGERRTPPQPRSSGRAYAGRAGMKDLSQVERVPQFDPRYVKRVQQAR